SSAARSSCEFAAADLAARSRAASAFCCASACAVVRTARGVVVVGGAGVLAVGVVALGRAMRYSFLSSRAKTSCRRAARVRTVSRSGRCEFVVQRPRTLHAAPRRSRRVLQGRAIGSPGSRGWSSRISSGSVGNSAAALVSCRARWIAPFYARADVFVARDFGDVDRAGPRDIWQALPAMACNRPLRHLFVASIAGLLDVALAVEGEKVVVGHCAPSLRQCAPTYRQGRRL